MFGREVEESLGRRSFLTLYFASGIIGGLFQALGGVFLGGYYAAPVVGASAGAFGLIAAFAMLYPERPLTMLVFLIVPVNMRAKFLLLFEGLVAVIGVVSPGFAGGNVAHAAHLGGMLTGIVFVRYAIYWHWRWPRFKQASGRQPRRLVNVHAHSSGHWGTKRAVPEDLPPDEFLSKEVDPILDKISAQGIQSLTDRERLVLEAARAKMAKR
jgi:hypothetical protein